MKLNFKIHNRNHIIKNFIGNIEYLFSNSKLQNSQLTVVNYHGTQKTFIHNFRKQILFFKKHFYIIPPELLSKFYNGELNDTEKPLMLITFDDGIKNNVYAAEILYEYKIKAYFFIVPDFIDCPISKQKEYFRNYIRPKINTAIDSEIEDYTALTWNEVKLLISQGHSIGSHTKTHTLIAKESTLENSITEIQLSKENIASKLNLPLQSINAFCSINNTLESISNKELKLIKENYKYHFTTIPGQNSAESSPYFIKRANIESYWLAGALKYAIGIWNLKRWTNATNAYLIILNSK